MLDNVEKIVEYDRRLFMNDFVTQLLKECPNLQIMLSTYELMEGDYISGSVEPKAIYVEELDALSSVDLFKKKALRVDEFSAQEVYDLVKVYPYVNWSRVP